jgi:hypothetical protein
VKNRRSSHAGSQASTGKRRFKHSRIALAMCLLAALGVTGHYLLSPRVYGAQLPFRSMQLSDDEASVSANYFLKFFSASPGTLGSIEIQFCSNSALIGDPCTPPVGFDDSAATLINQSGATGFSISNASTTNELILTRTPSAASTGFVTYEFSGVTNPSSSGSYYVRVQTFASNDVSGPATDFGSMAIDILNNIAISTEVPPYLIFCTGVTITGFNCANAEGDFIDFGELSFTKASSASSQMLIATNAQSGYGITVDGPTMASGTNIITGLTTGDVSRPGNGQFGFNLSANSTPSGGSDPSGLGTGTPTPAYDQPNIFQLNSGDLIAASPVPDNLRKFTADYIVNVPPAQAPGIYVTTLTYIALATF